MLDSFFTYVPIPVWFWMTVKVWFEFGGETCPSGLGWLDMINMLLLYTYAIFPSIMTVIVIPGFFFCNGFF